MAAAADEAGWDGFFLWDHVTFPYPGVPMEDPWTLLGAVAVKTKIIKLGTLVTPLPRRRPQILAKQLTTLDELSCGRAVLGVGIGGDPNDFTAFGENASVSRRAEMLDEALDVITSLWSGETVNHDGRHYHLKGVTLLPTPVQRPRILIYVGGDKLGALRRAARFDGWVPVGPAPDAGAPGLSLDQVKVSVDKIKDMRQRGSPFEVIYMADFPKGEKVFRKYLEDAKAAGVTWLIDNIYGLRYTEKQALKAIKAGPPKKS